MSESIIFRPFEPKDLFQISELESLSFRPEIALSFSRLRAICSDDSTIGFVFEQLQAQGRSLLLGNLLLRLESFAKTIVILSVTVRPEHRRSGLGTSALNHLKGMADAIGVERMIIQVDTYQTEARPFLEANGFRSGSALENFLLEGNAGVEMIYDCLASANSDSDAEVPKP